MAKTPKNGDNLPAKKNGDNLPAPFEMDAGDVALGGKVTSADLAIPFLKILQGPSKELKRDKPEYIKGAAIGDLCLTVLNRHWSSEEGVEIIPCHYQRVFVEWRPLDMGGGIINTYPPGDKIIGTGERGEKGGALTLPNGNDLIETAYHAILVKVDNKWVPSVMPLKSTMLKISKRLNNELLNFEVPTGKGYTVNAPRWARIFKMTTGTATGGGNDWAVPIFEPGKVVTSELYKQGRDWAIAANKATNFAAAEAAQNPEDRPEDLPDQF